MGNTRATERGRESVIHQKAFDELDVDEVLKRYGYKPEEIHCNGIGIGVWRTEEAFQKYKEYKEQYIKDTAKRYKDKIPYSVYEAMMNWKVEITD